MKKLDEENKERKVRHGKGKVVYGDKSYFEGEFNEDKPSNGLFVTEDKSYSF